jgi:hypothetical protein
MNERLTCLLSEVGESFDYLKSDVRNLSRYIAQLEELIEGYRTFVSNATLATQADEVVRRKLLSKTQKIVGPPSDVPKDVPNTHDSISGAPSAHFSSSHTTTTIK